MYDADGKKTWEADLDIYGRVRTFVGRSLNDCPFRYQGQYQDIETGLYYNRFRYYDADVGSYISQDPIGLAGNNPTLYGYVKDVNSWIDEFGLDCGKNKGKVSKGEPPPNLTPKDAKRRGAFRSAKRASGIPMGEQPLLVTSAKNKSGNVIPGRDYHFENGKVIREHFGHSFPDNPSQNRGTHFNDIFGNHYDY